MRIAGALSVAKRGRAACCGRPVFSRYGAISATTGQWSLTYISSGSVVEDQAVGDHDIEPQVRERAWVRSTELQVPTPDPKLAAPHVPNAIHPWDIRWVVATQQGDRRAIGLGGTPIRARSVRRGATIV